MTGNHGISGITTEAVINWLLDSDPSIRWQVKRDILGEPETAVAAERSRVAREGWGAGLLELQGGDGDWGGGPWMYQSWASSMETLMLLRELGVDAQDQSVREAVNLLSESSNWGEWHGHSPFFEGESEPCINGRVVALGAYFGHPSDRLVDRLLDEQLPDGGWNCDAPESERSSFNTTICVLEGLLEYEVTVRGTNDVTSARLRGQEYLLERKLFRSLSTKKIICIDRKSGRDWRKFTFPTRWHYDILWGLDYLRKAQSEPDERTHEALDLISAAQRTDGRWPLGDPHPGEVHFHMEEGGNLASRWNTLRAIRVLGWFGYS